MILYLICNQIATTENNPTQHLPSEKLVPADQTRSTRDILHLIQSRVTDESSLSVSNAATCSINTETVSNGLRQFQVRPQLFEAIMMQPTSASKSNCNMANNSASYQTNHNPIGLFSFV